MRNVVAGLVAVALAACSGGDGGGGPTGGSSTGTISGQVIDVDSANGGLPGVTVQFTSGSSTPRTATTGANGSFTLTQVTPGAWQAQVQVPATHRLPGGESGTRTANVSANQTASLTPFQLSRPKGTVTGVIEEEGEAVAGGTVTLKRGGFTDRTATPTETGYTFADVPAGSWTLEYTPPASHRLASGETGTRTVAVAENQTATATTIELEALQLVEIHLTAATVFSVDDITIKPGTTIRWINDAALMHTITPENSSQPGVWQRVETSAPGVVLEHTFTVADQTYRYRCEPHSANFTTGMVGVIRVSQ